MSAARLIAAWLALAAGAAAQWLHDPEAYPAGDVPHVSAAGDLDGDGHPDLVVLGGGGLLEPPATLTVMLGTPDGTLGFGTTSVIGGHVNALQLGDITGDGLLDVVISDAFEQQLDIRAGDGKGGFAPPVHAATHTNGDVFTLGDLDLDGALDAATGNGASHSVTLMHNDHGSLVATAIVPVAGVPTSLSIALFDGDTLPDVLVPQAATTVGNGVQLLAGLGGGAVAQAVPVYATIGLAAAPADLDADGDLDLVQLRGGFNSPAILDTALNGGTGVLSFKSTLTAGGLDPRGVAAADFNLDGAADAVATSHGDDTLRTARGDGAGNLLAGPLTLALVGPISVISAELSGDGRPDVAVITTASDAVQILRANDGRLRLAPSLTTNAGNGPQALRLADLDLDGNDDAVDVSPSKDVLNRMLGTGTGDFTLKKSYDAGDLPVDLELGDLDGDGDVDAVVAASTASEIRVLLGNGAGGFAPPVATPAMNLASSVILRDFDGDGRLDVLVGNVVTPSLQLFRGDGAAGWLPPTSFALPAVAKLGVGDVDGDFDLDLVTGTYTTQDVRTWLNDGTGNFAPQAAVRTGTSPSSPVVADLDDDGVADVAVTTGDTGYQSGSVAVLHGDGAGGLQAPVHVPMPLIFGLHAADLNGDGRPELMTTGLYVISSTNPATSFSVLHVLEADEGGAFEVPSMEADDGGTSSVLTDDLDGDGRLDVVMLGSGGVVAKLNASEPHPWHDVGSALAGAHGEPKLAGVGWAQAGTAGALELREAHENAVAVLFVSPVSTPTPFKGGVLLPVPPAIATPLLTDVHGGFTLGWSSWPPLTTGSTYWLQVAIADPVAPHGVALSNATKLIQP